MIEPLHIAVDANGSAYFYLSKPHREGDEWFAPGPSMAIPFDFLQALNIKLSWDDEPLEILLAELINNPTSAVRINDLPSACQVCSCAHCMQPMGKLACEHYVEREQNNIQHK